MIVAVIIVVVLNTATWLFIIARRRHWELNAGAPEVGRAPVPEEAVHKDR